MTFPTLKTHLKALPCGKKLNHSVYIIEESLQIVDEQLYSFVADLKTRVDAYCEYNIIKFFTNEFKISWLSYPDFFIDPHPSLKKSLTLNIATGKIRKFNYDKSLNTPILHRKEVFLHPGHPQIESFSELTKRKNLMVYMRTHKQIYSKLAKQLKLSGIHSFSFFLCFCGLLPFQFLLFGQLFFFFKSFNLFLFFLAESTN